MKCDTCNKDLDEKAFYHFKDNSASSTCKACECHKYDREQFCKRYDIPSIKSEWDKLEKKLNPSFRFTNMIANERYWMYGRYLSKMKLCSYRNYRYEDTVYLKKIEEENKMHRDINAINYEIKEYEREGGNTDLVSDGVHTFGDLYEQRAYLFAAIVNLFPERSYKSWRHSDGERCFGSENWFIVGIVTPEGQYTYHYERKYWDLFKCGEVERAPEWDGHTDKDVSRLLSLAQEV